MLCYLKIYEIKLLVKCVVNFCLDIHEESLKSNTEETWHNDNTPHPSERNNSVSSDGNTVSKHNEGPFQAGTNNILAAKDTNRPGQPYAGRKFHL